MTDAPRFKVRPEQDTVEVRREGHSLVASGKIPKGNIWTLIYWGQKFISQQTRWWCFHSVGIACADGVEAFCRLKTSWAGKQQETGGKVRIPHIRDLGDLSQGGSLWRRNMIHLVSTKSCGAWNRIHNSYNLPLLYYIWKNMVTQKWC